MNDTGGGGKIGLASAPWAMHEFFAGSGLVAYGLRGAFRPAWANDVCPKKAFVYRSNFAADHFVLCDIKDVSGGSLPCADLSWASFPCQDLSLAGAMRGIDAKRSGLVWEFVRVLGEMPRKPGLLLLENVAGLLSAAGGAHYGKLHRTLAGMGYRCGAIVVDAARFVPQSRPRVFVIAVRKEVPIPGELLDGGRNWLHNNAAAKIGNEIEGWIWWKAREPAPRTSSISDILDLSLPYDKDHVLSIIPPAHWEKLNQHKNAIATGYRRTRRGKQCLELRFDGVAGCLRTPRGGSSKQFIVVKTGRKIRARIVSSREVARLMGAPDTYKLPGSCNDAYNAMGDAVVMPVASFICHAFLTKLAEAAR